MKAKDLWTEPRVFEMLSKVFPDGAYALLPQVRNGTGYIRGTTRTADAIAVSCWPSRGLYLAGIEIKVSLADWRKELAEGAKAHEIGQYCRYWYVAAPEGIVPVGEVPEKWGLIECTDKNAKIAKAAVANEEKPVDILLLAAILRAVSKVTVPKSQMTAQIRDAVEEKVEAEKSRMEHEVKRLEDKIARFEEASGVEITTYRERQIGEAVKMVLEGKHLNINTQIQSIGRIARGIVDAIDKMEEAEEVA